MNRRVVRFLSVLVGLMCVGGSARADVIIALEAFGTNGQPITGTVASGTDVVVDILLSVDSEDDPLADVRLIQFDFEATSSLIVLGAFTWTVDPNVYYSFPGPGTEYPLKNVVAVLTQSGPGILTLTSEPVKVANIQITVNGSGTLDLINPENTGEDDGAFIRASFSEERIFRDSLGNLQGGTLEFTASGSDGGGGDDGSDGGDGTDIPGVPEPEDQDGDGVLDVDDAFPENPGETTDTNGDGEGDNADPDDDGDEVVDEEDDFPLDSGETTDSNGDGVGDVEDPDDDGDNVADESDAFPGDPDEAMDSDDDGIGNNADTDDDNDGVEDADDAFPLVPNQGDDDEGDGGGDDATGSSPSMCGAGMLSSSVLMLMGLGLMSYRPRRGF